MFPRLCSPGYVPHMLAWIEFLPNLQVIHFITDSPSSQYRNRKAVELIRRFPEIFGDVRATWTWLENGKGPYDGMGGAIKKTLTGT